jgi:transcriptional regulator with XRE-family HTH domain
VEKTIFTTEHEVLVKLLRRLREKAGLRQIDLASRLGRPQSFVSKYEAGQRRLDLVELRMLCDVFGLTLMRFVQRFESELAQPGVRREDR